MMWPFTRKKKEKKMGGVNESVLPADDKGSKKKKDDAGAAGPGMGGNLPGMVLQPDFVPPPANTYVPPPPSLSQQNSGVPLQTQAIRQHMNAGQVHLHVDGPQPLKAAIPVAEWFVIMRHLRSLSPFTFVDSDNKCVAYLRPYVHGGLFEVAIELSPIQVGARFQEMNAVTAKK